MPKLPKTCSYLQLLVVEEPVDCGALADVGVPEESHREPGLARQPPHRAHDLVGGQNPADVAAIFVNIALLAVGAILVVDGGEE